MSYYPPKIAEYPNETHWVNLWMSLGLNICHNVSTSFNRCDTENPNRFPLLLKMVETS